jgi:hypothetical protein
VYTHERDELLPLSRSGRNWCELGLTLIDSLDLLWLIHDDDSFHQAVAWIEHDFDPQGVFNIIFERHNSFFFLFFLIELAYTYTVMDPLLS